MALARLDSHLGIVWLRYGRVDQAEHIRHLGARVPGDPGRGPPALLQMMTQATWH